MKVIQTGLIAGILMSGYLATLSITGNYGGSAVKYFKYIILIGFLAAFFNRLLKHYDGATFLSKYIKNGAIISAVSGFMVAITNIVLFFVNQEYSFQKFNLLAASLFEAITISGVLLIEVTVLGLICSLIIFPFYKNRVSLK